MRLENVSETVGVFVNRDNRIEKFNELIKLFLPLEQRINISIDLDLEVDNQGCCISYVTIRGQNVLSSTLLSAKRRVAITLEQLYK